MGPKESSQHISIMNMTSSVSASTSAGQSLGETLWEIRLELRIFPPRDSLYEKTRPSTESFGRLLVRHKISLFSSRPPNEFRPWRASGLLKAERIQPGSRQRTLSCLGGSRPSLLKLAKGRKRKCSAELCCALGVVGVYHRWFGEGGGFSRRWILKALFGGLKLSTVSLGKLHGGALAQTKFTDVGKKRNSRQRYFDQGDLPY